MSADTAFDVPDEELLRRAVSLARVMRSRGHHTRREAVMNTFLLGSTYASILCRRFELDPDEMVKR